MKLYDQTGAQVDVPDEQATAAIASGRFGLPADHIVHVATDDGVKALPFAQAVEHVQKGATIATPGQVRQADLDARFGGVGGSLEAAGEGGLAGATFGLSDAAIAGLGGDKARQRLADVREAHPYIRGGAELAGSLAPALLTGGASEAATAGELGLEAANAADKAGQVGSLVKAAGRVLAAPSEAVGAVGSTFERGVGKLVGEEATSLGGRVAQGAAKAAGRGVAEGAIVGGGQELSEQSLGPAPLNGEKLLAAVGHGALLGGLGGAGLGAAGEIGSEVLGSEVVGRLSTRLSGTAEERAASAIGAKATDLPGGVKGIGRELLDRELVKAGDTAGDVAARISSERAQVGKELGGLLDQADAAGAVVPDLAKAQTKAQTKLAKLGLDVAPPQPLIGGFRQAVDLRTQLDEVIAGAPHPALKAIRAKLDTEIDQAAKTAGKTLGEAWRTEYEGTSLSARRLSVADESAQKLLATRAAQPAPDRAMAVGGAILALLHVASPLILATTIAGRLAHKYIAERGASTAAVYLDKVAQLGAVRRAAAAVDRRIAAGVDRAVTGKGGEAALKLHDSSGSYQAKRKLVADAAGDMGSHRDTIETASSSIAAHAPETAAAFKAAAVRSSAYLAKAMPAHPPTQSLIPQSSKPYEPPPDVQAAFVRKYDAVHDPVILLAHAHAGTLSGDMVEAVQATHPELLAQMRTATVSRLGDLPPGKGITQGQKESLTTLLGQPVDQTVSPAFVQSAQATFTATPDAPPRGAPGRKTGNGAPKREIKSASLSSLSSPYGSKS